MDITQFIADQLGEWSIKSKVIENNKDSNDFVVKLIFHGIEEYIQICPYENGKYFSLSWAVDKRTAMRFLKNYKYIEFDYWEVKKNPPIEFIRSDAPNKYHFIISSSALLKNPDYMKYVKSNELWHIVISRFTTLNYHSIKKSIKEFYNLRLYSQQYPDETNDSKVFSEGAIQKVVVSKYERDPQARAKCIQHYGYKCFVCDFVFSELYGQIGFEYIHVHHIKLLSSHRKSHKVDPIKDLRPMCPNCHAMLHQKEPPYGIDELKIIIKKASNRLTKEPDLHPDKSLQ